MERWSAEDGAMTRVFIFLPQVAKAQLPLSQLISTRTLLVSRLSTKKCLKMNPRLTGRKKMFKKIVLVNFALNFIDY